MIYFTSNFIKPREQFTAIAKVQRDYAAFFKDLNFEQLQLPKNVGNGAAESLFSKLTLNDAVIYQYPQFAGSDLAKERIIMAALQECGAKVIIMVHDVYSLRAGAYRDSENLEVDLLNQADVVIFHTDQMAQGMKDLGFAGAYVIQGPFGYRLTPQEEATINHDVAVKPDHWPLIYTGNMDKALFMFGYANQTPIALFGPWPSKWAHRPEDVIQKPLNYRGVVPAEELPLSDYKGFALVWDGKSKPAGMKIADYTKYNMPLKFSNYLTHGLPVVVWSQAAIADIVRAEGLGLVLDDLSALDQELAKVDVDTYLEMIVNVARYGQALRDGQTVKEAVKGAIEMLENPQTSIPDCRVTLFDDFGMYNHNPIVLGVKGLFDRKGLPAQVITTHNIVMKQAAASVHHMPLGSVWSIYDYFTGRISAFERPNKISDFIAPQGYQPLVALDNKKFVDSANDTNYLTITTRPNGDVDMVTYYEGDQELYREGYDDGGQLNYREYHKNNGFRVEYPDQYGNVIFNINQNGKRQIESIAYLPEELVFDGEMPFLTWAFERMVQLKSDKDRFFVVNRQLREALLHADFNRNGVYLLPTENMGKRADDILLDRYEKVISNVQSEVDDMADRFSERTESKLYWNNFIPTDVMAKRYDAERKWIYLNIAPVADLDYGHLATALGQVYQAVDNVGFVAQFQSRYDRDRFLESINALEIEGLREVIEHDINPKPDLLSRKLAKSRVYVETHLQGLVSSEIIKAIGLQIPIIARPEIKPELRTYINDQTGKLVAMPQLSDVLIEASQSLAFYASLAEDLKAKALELSDDATFQRWCDILQDDEAIL